MIITEKILRKYPSLIRFLTGLPAENFWELMEQVEAQVLEYEHQRHERAGRQRAFGAGRPVDQPLLLRVVMLLSYLRLHVPQTLIALLFGATHTDVSRDLRRLLALLKQLLPVPAVWQIVGEGETLAVVDRLAPEQLADGRVLVDATEQVVYRPQRARNAKATIRARRKPLPSRPSLCVMANIILPPSA